MARIQTYPLDGVLDDADMLVGTDGTVGPELNKTKNFTLSDLKNYINSGGGGGGSQNLQQVTDLGNTTTNSIKAKDLRLFDSADGNYGKITLSDSRFSFITAQNKTSFFSEDGILSVVNLEGFEGQIDTSAATAKRIYSLPDKSGTIALTSDTRPYKVFTALLTQSGGGNGITITSGELVIGVTYKIKDSGGDWINVGAPNNDVETYFVATGITPNNWGVGSLIYNEGAPIATVLENTIGNVWFNYNDVGDYSLNSNGLFGNQSKFLPIKTVISDLDNDKVFNFWAIWDGSNAVAIITKDNAWGSFNNFLDNTPFEIRIYN